MVSEARYSLPGQSNTRHCVKDGIVRDVIWQGEGLPVEARLQRIDVLSFPQAYHVQWGPKVNEERAR